MTAPAARHLMICTETAGAESLFECTVCGRRLVLGPGARFVTLDDGDTGAFHHGSTGLVALEVSGMGGDG